MKPILRYLRSKGIIIGVYFDDILTIANCYEKCLENVRIIVSLLEKLGFIINYEKSDLIPKQTCTYLGFVINTQDCTLTLTENKKN